MFRSTLIAAGAVALCGAGFAQQQLDPAKIRPLTVPVRDAGVFNWNTKQWVSGPKAAQQLASTVTVFNNTCSYVGGGGYYGIEHCEDVIDNGRLPSATTPLNSLPGVDSTGVHTASGVVLSGATDDNLINNFQFAYCTAFPAGQVDIKIGFYDVLRGLCAAGIPVKGKPYYYTLPSQATSFSGNPFGGSTAYFDFAAGGTFQLPGGTTLGSLACWSVTITIPNNGGFCMVSEGNGSWDNNDNLDWFSWSFEHDNPTTVAGVAGGPILAGEPNSGGWGAGSYNIPAGSDAAGGGDCGTGFSSGDAWWLNIDSSAPGIYQTTTVAGAACPAQAPAGTNCYWFGGWPGNPLGSFWMVMGSLGDCNGCANRSVSYCTAGTSSDGCQAMIYTTGTSSSGAASGFNLNVLNAGGSKNGLFFFGTNGRQANQWGNGTSFQCVVPPVKRTPASSTTGTNGQCDGTSMVDLNVQWTNKPTQDPGAGALVQAQFWYRDPSNTSNQKTVLSNAIEWTVCP